MAYKPKPLKPYTPKPLKPYLPASLKPYLPVSRKPFLEKPDPKAVGWPLREDELEALRALARAGGTATVLRLSRIMGKGLRRVSSLYQVLAEADYIDRFEGGLCRLKPLAWRELEKDGENCPGARYAYLDISYVELQALLSIADAGGANTLRTIADSLSLPRRETSALCRGLGTDNYIHLFQTGLVRLTDQGWQELEKVGYRGTSYSRLGISQGELQALKVITEAGGEATVKTVAEALGTARRQAATYCQALGQGDYIDLFVSGRCVMKRKGWQMIHNLGQGAP